MAMTVMKGLVKRLREADQKIGSLALMDVYGRVAHLLLDIGGDRRRPKGGHPEDRQAGYRQDDRRFAARWSAG